MILLYKFFLNFFTDEDFRNKLIEVEKENIIAKQDVVSLRTALEQERKKVKYMLCIMRLTQKLTLTQLVETRLSFIALFTKACPEPIEDSVPFHIAQ